MRQRLAGALGVAIDQVNVKAKTAEKMGPVGRGESIEARAVCLSGALDEPSGEGGGGREGRRGEGKGGGGGGRQRKRGGEWVVESVRS